MLDLFFMVAAVLFMVRLAIHYDTNPLRWGVVSSVLCFFLGSLVGFGLSILCFWLYRVYERRGS